MPIARRGEVWRVDFGLAGKVRPALILNVPFQDHERALFTVIPHTTALRGTRFEAIVRVQNLERGAFDAQGIRSLPGAALLGHLATLTSQELAQVEATFQGWLGFR